MFYLKHSGVESTLNEYNQDTFWILIISSHCQLEWFGKMANIENSLTNKPKNWVKPIKWKYKKLSETYKMKI